mgnify:CR=1 FL=1
MIPKIIHYIWFGGKPLPKLAKKCIKSWKKYCPDYKIMRWDENNFDINMFQYTKEAYESKKWAFISDVVRLYVLVNYGGIYMDTDVEVIKPLDEFLRHKAFSGFEDSVHIPTGIMACEKGNPIFKELLGDYKGRAYILANGKTDTTTNVVTITNLCLKLGLEQNDNFQIINGFALYPHDWFCPKNCMTNQIELTENSHTIHHFAGSWLDKKIIKRKKYYDFFVKIGARNPSKLAYVFTNKRKVFRFILNKILNIFKK